MNFIDDFKNHLFAINEESFEDSSLALFDFQYHNNAIYKQYCDAIHKTPKSVNRLESIPFMPVEFFKSHLVKSGNWKTVQIFKSSGTSGSIRSQHHVRDLEFYYEISQRIFESFFGPIGKYRVAALLPSYQEQGNSSLICMVDSFIKKAKHFSGYFLQKDLSDLANNENKTVLFGVAYALLDAGKIPMNESTLVIETGGMKGRKKELTRNELHSILKNNLSLNQIWSEYGMTELLSQAYGRNGTFEFPAWAKVLIREVNDPFSLTDKGKVGGINIVDLANFDSCAFIETKDLGKVQKNNAFEVLGRFDNSEIRGCNLLI